MTQKRYTPAANARDNKKEMWKLTQKQWLIYYWVLAHSYWNPDENYYYIYKEKMPSSLIQKEVGVTAPTIRSAVAKFLELGIFEQHFYIQDAYILTRPIIYTSLDTNIIKFCLGFHEFFGSDLITFYAILRRLYVLEKVVKFNLSEFAMLMGCFKQNVDKSKIHLMLGLCSLCGLITVEEKFHTNRMGQEVNAFIVTEVKDVATKQVIACCAEDEINVREVHRLYHALVDSSNEN